jgi:hypothetical protein
MSKKRKQSHTTTKNTIKKVPVTRLLVIGLKLETWHKEFVTDFLMEDDFHRLFYKWYDDPKTTDWSPESLILYIKNIHPNRICVLKEDYDNITKGKVIEATREEWLREQN